MTLQLADLIFLAGCGQLCILMASAMVPVRLQWKSTLAPLPPLVRQLFWVYGGYVILNIVSLGLICLTNATELASGTALARCVCIYGMLFWGIRLSLQPFLKASPYLTTWWLRAGYHWLSVMFVTFTIIFGYGAFH